VITSAKFDAIVAALHRTGQAQKDIDWSENVRPPDTAEDFAREAIFVIANSGMRHTVAVEIFSRAIDALELGGSATSAFGHPGKAAAMDRIWNERHALFRAYQDAEDKLAYCHSLPYIGRITRYHLAKNFGVDCAKPDVHLQRLADLGGESVEQMCRRLAMASRFRVATVDVLLWRASATGVLNSRTGELVAR